ncbi:MAG: long-chain-fatty-acid--CoA ligase [Novosphingobium lindaniclasticum]|jgi:long-chain acyl-CoA synthetase|uniref:class I adenylate-forming enzyme family protein n=1 Tax=Novosphingobium lindaniclasticum TaxID=1329895 RepID=UPI0024095FF3|nr:AMP-binding protein [Novosphingobium lindaniclasticum]MDF2639519.1 long-chain-fatty-acid--CoA ligase [Novosphingobium lindaniclasticum]
MSSSEAWTENATRPWMDLYPHDLRHGECRRHAHILSAYRANLRSDAEAIRYFDGSLTGNELDRLSDGFAVWLQERGVAVGDRVGIVLQNVPHFAIASLGIWKIGAIPVPGNPMYHSNELARVFDDYGPAAVVCHEDQRAEILDAFRAVGTNVPPLAIVDAHDFHSIDDHRVLPPVGPASALDFLDLCRVRSGRKPVPAPIQPSATALILYTSGTTGAPKGAVIRHESLAFNAQASSLWMKIDHRSRILALAPLFHITGFVLHMAAGLAAGCSVALGYRFHPGSVIDMLRTYRPTTTIAAITAFNALLNTEGITPDEFVSFENVFTGGAPIAPALRDAVTRHLGVTLCPVYGMTESCSSTHIAPPGLEIPVHPATGALSVGLPISYTDARIAGLDGEEVAPGTPGEIWMRGPQIMSGYWNKPEENAVTLHDGWLRSGDVGIMDERGWFYVIDRQKDMINASGFKVWPREVEDVLLEHPDVREAAVIGVPDAYRCETVRAFVSIKPGVLPPDAASLIAHCRERLAAYKVPRQVEVVSDLPKTPTGKIRRAALRTLPTSSNA